MEIGTHYMLEQLAALGSLKFERESSLAMQQLQRARERAPRQRRTAQHAANGERAMARRRRQIAAGSLRVENGLVL